MADKVFDVSEVDLDAPVARAVLTAVQTALPVEEHPYAALGAACGTDEAGAFAVVKAARAAGIVRRIGASFDSYKLGYISTLAALAVPADDLDHVAALVGAHPGITHNYERDDRYNLWFTCIAHGRAALERELESIQRETGLDDLLVLPALRLFKVRVAFDVREGASAGDATPHAAGAPDFIVPANTVPLDLDGVDRALVRALQGDLAGDVRPFALAAAQVSELVGRTVSEAEVLKRTRALVEARAIRRLGTMVRHRKMGFVCNAMGVWDIPDDQVEQAGVILARPASVSHCYERPRRATWPWNLYTMIHGRDRAECEQVAANLHAELAAAGITVEPPRMLVSTREFKKTSMRYFEED